MEGMPKGDAVGDIEAQAEEAHRRADRAGAWVQEMEELTGRGTAMRGGVAVEIDLGGTVTGLGISDAAAARGGREVARAVLEAHARASEELRRRAEESTAHAWGADSATTTAVREEVDRLTPRARGTDGNDGLGPRATRPGGAW
jgi:soluble lytic murein transglycosylase-like protein